MTVSPVAAAVAAIAAIVLIMLPAIHVMQPRHKSVSVPVSVALPATMITTTGPVPTPSPGAVPEDPRAVAGPLGSVALTVSENMRVVGQLVADDVVVNGISVSTILAMMRTYSSQLCGQINCVHGLTLAFTTCACVCDPHWTGAACDVHDCYSHGTWQSEGFCACTGLFLSDTLCRLMPCRGLLQESCPALPLFGCSLPGAVAPNCSVVSAVPAASAVRSNWGSPHEPTPEYPFGICGGGFRRIAGITTIVISTMECPVPYNATSCLSQWISEAQICCGPAGLCDLINPLPQQTCPMHTQHDTCLLNGCAWCTGYCMSPAVANVSIDCEYAPDVAPNVSGTWSSWSYACTDALCIESVVERYLLFWGNLSSYNYNAYVSIRDSPWPELGQYAVPPGRAVTINLTQAGYIGIQSGQLVFSDTPVPWTVLYSGLDPTPWMLEGAPVQLVTMEAGNLYCMASSRMSSLLQLQLFGTVQTPLSAATRFTVDAPVCGAFRLDTPVLRDELGTSFMTSDLVWATTGIAPAMTVHTLE